MRGKEGTRDERMRKYIIKRLLQLIPILIGITLLSFILMQTSSMDAIDVMEQNTGGSMSEAESSMWCG